MALATSSPAPFLKNKQYVWVFLNYSIINFPLLGNSSSEIEMI